MNRILDDLIEGRDVKMYGLREGDYFMDLYDKIKVLKSKLNSGGDSRS
jgi:hypothetical protein